MREIKFRAWNGQEMVFDITVGKFGNFYVNPDNNGLDRNDSASLSTFTTKYPNSVPIMQYTGLKDKNGKEIYEGDILEMEQIQGLGKFKGVVHIGADPTNEYDCRVWVDTTHEESSKRGWGSSHVFIHKNPEIIGNIYENPELLK